MSIVVTTPTGNIGSAVVENLLQAGIKPVLIARDPSKVKHFTDRGAEVRKGSHADSSSLIEATRGAQTLFWVTPPDITVEDIHAYYKGFADAAVQAIRENNISRVVHLSSVGAEVPSGTGPIAAIHETEETLNKTVKNVTHLRPGYFMENTLAQIPVIQSAGSLFTMFPTGFRFPMIATRDIGARAATVLGDENWTGRRVMELRGAAEETGYDDVAAILSDVLGKDLKHVSISGGQFIEALLGMGASKAVAEAYAEMSNAIVDGTVKHREPQSAENTTPTSYREFAEQVFKPAFNAAG